MPAGAVAVRAQRARARGAEAVGAGVAARAGCPSHAVGPVGQKVPAL